MDTIPATPMGISGGIGINYDGFVFDYAMVNTRLGISNIGSLSYCFGGYDLLLKAEPATFSPVSFSNKSYIRITANTKYEIYKWRVEIKNADGKTMKDGKARQNRLTRKYGRPARRGRYAGTEGDYTAVISITDENDDVQKSDAIKITISSSGNKGHAADAIKLLFL